MPRKSDRPVIHAVVRLRRPSNGRGMATKGPIRILVDSGASMSVVPQSAVDLLSERSGKVRSKKVMVSTVGSSLQPIHRTPELAVCVGRVCTRVPVLVSKESLPVDMILGADFLKKAKCSIDFPSNSVKCGSSSFPIRQE